MFFDRLSSTFDGAGYLDYGVFAQAHSAWLDDSAGDVSVPMAVPQQSFYGATLAFPARFLTLWLARGPVGPGVEGRGMSPDDLRYQGYSTMGGSWGLSLRLGDLDPAQRRAVQDLIEDYVVFRDLVPGARVYHLQPPLAAPPAGTLGTQPVQLPAVGDWFVLQYLYSAGYAASGAGDVAYLAHVFGFLAGLVIGLLVRAGSPAPQYPVHPRYR